VVVMVLYAVLYQFTMATFEDQRVSFPKALLAVVETFTTTGYGEDAQFWESVQMQVLMIAMQLTGVSAVFLALPVFVAPWVESRLSETAPTAVEDMSDHVVVAGYTSRVDALIDELSALDRPYVVVEPDREVANELYAETELNVIHGDPELGETLSAAEVGRARALVCDVDDETNASIVLAAHGMGVDGVDVITFVEDPAIAAYHRYAGADEVFSPRQLIGESLAKKVTAGVTPELDGAIEIAEDFDIVELPVQAGSEIVGKTVAEAGVRERTGTNIVGAWFRGEFASPPPPDARIDEQTILVVAGRERQLERLKELTLSERRRQNGGPVVVAGFDEVGTTVVEQIGGRVRRSSWTCSTNRASTSSGTSPTRRRSGRPGSTRPRRSSSRSRTTRRRCSPRSSSGTSTPTWRSSRGPTPPNRYGSSTRRGRTTCSRWRRSPGGCSPRPSWTRRSSPSTSRSRSSAWAVARSSAARSPRPTSAPGPA